MFWNSHLGPISLSLILMEVETSPKSLVTLSYIKYCRQVLANKQKPTRPVNQQNFSIVALERANILINEYLNR